MMSAKVFKCYLTCHFSWCRFDWVYVLDRRPSTGPPDQNLYRTWSKARWVAPVPHPTVRYTCKFDICATIKNRRCVIKNVTFEAKLVFCVNVFSLCSIDSFQPPVVKSPKDIFLVLSRRHPLLIHFGSTCHQASANMPWQIAAG